MDKFLFSFENYKTFLQEVNNFLSQHIKKYNQIDHGEIKKYPAKYQEQILSSIFCTDRKDMVIDKKTIHEHFKKPPKSYGRGKFLKKNRDDSYASF